MLLVSSKQYAIGIFKMLTGKRSGGGKQASGPSPAGEERLQVRGQPNAHQRVTASAEEGCHLSLSLNLAARTATSPFQSSPRLKGHIPSATQSEHRRILFKKKEGGREDWREDVDICENLFQEKGNGHKTTWQRVPGGGNWRGRRESPRALGPARLMSESDLLLGSTPPQIQKATCLLSSMIKLKHLKSPLESKITTTKPACT